MDLIVAVDQRWGIGKNGGLLAHLPGDLKYFREKTEGKVVIMGRSTLESLPGGKPLPGRTNVVLTRSEDFAGEGCRVVHRKEDVLALEKEFPTEQLMIIGGGSVYREFIHNCQRLYITKIFSCFEADTHFPDVDGMSEFRLVWESPVQLEKGLSYLWAVYERV